jgi:hypothetical protein
LDGSCIGIWAVFHFSMAGIVRGGNRSRFEGAKRALGDDHGANVVRRVAASKTDAMGIHDTQTGPVFMKSFPALGFIGYEP